MLLAASVLQYVADQKLEILPIQVSRSSESKLEQRLRIMLYSPPSTSPLTRYWGFMSDIASSRVCLKKCPARKVA